MPNKSAKRASGSTLGGGRRRCSPPLSGGGAKARKQITVASTRWITRQEDGIDSLLQSISRLTPVALRVAFGIVYLWFGALKITGHSPVAHLVADTLPFANPTIAVDALGAVEMLLGAGLLVGRAQRLLLLACVMHLAGTFLTFVVAPHLMFDHGDVALLTDNGEFVLKNLVLIGAALLLATSYTSGTARRQAGDPTASETASEMERQYENHPAGHPTAVTRQAASS